MLPRVVPLPHAGDLRRLLARVTPGGGRQAPGREVLLDHKVANDVGALRSDCCIKGELIADTC